jgi:hypothetical protein
MKKHILLILLFTQCFLLPAQSLEEVETFGLFQTSPQKGLYRICSNTKEEIISVEKDTFQIPKLHFVPAIYDTIGWDTVFVFPKHTYYRLKMNNEGDTSELHLWENGKEIWISAPIFKPIYHKQNLVEPYWVWKSTRRGLDPNTMSCYCEPNDCLGLALREIAPKKWFAEMQLIKPAEIHIQSGTRDTSFSLFPPSPYLETQVIPAKYVYMPKLYKTQQARIDTIWETQIIQKDKTIDSCHKFVRISRKYLGKIEKTECHNYSPVVQIQRLLQEKGFYKGELTDILDEETRLALIRFQKSHNLLPVSEGGKLNIDTLKPLGFPDDFFDCY